MEAAEQRRALATYCLHDLSIRQGQLDELYAVRSAVKPREGNEAQALEQLERSPQWGWVAMDPESTLLLAIEGGMRTLALAPGVVHQVPQVLAPGCVPLFWTD